MTRPGFPRHLVVLAAGYALSILATLGVFGSYHAFSGRPGLERGVVLFMMPVTGTAIWGLIRSLHLRSLQDQENGSADAAIRDIVFWVLVFLLGVHSLIVAILFGATWVYPWGGRVLVVLAGLTLMAVGNLLPRTRPNMALGIRTSRTLSDRQLWMMTHRMGGYTTVALGALTIYAGIFLHGAHVAGVPGTAFLMACTWLAASYWKAARHSSHHRA